MTGGLEAFDYFELANYVIKAHGGKRDRQNGSHTTYEVSGQCQNGRCRHGQYKFQVPRSSDSASSNVVRRIAKGLGMTYQSLRDDMGYPVVERVGGRPKNLRPKLTNSTKVGRGAVLTAAANLRSMVADLEREVKAGDRDPSVYENIFDVLVAAQAELTVYRHKHALMYEMAEHVRSG